jgi:hypothetical protein
MPDTPAPDQSGAGETPDRPAEPVPVPPATPIEPTAGRYCLRCRAPLRPYRPDESGPPRCRRCRLPYNPSDPRTYATNTALPPWKWAVLGFVLAVVTGVATYALIVLQADQGLAVLGYAAFFGVPLAVGALLGYFTRPSVWLAVLLSLFAVVCITFLLCSMQMSGLFCGAMLGLIFLGPAFVGVLLGAGLRWMFPRAAWDHRRWYVAILLAGSPLLAAAIEGRVPRETELGEVSTAMTFHATPQQAWDGIVFYEQVEHPPPWLLTLALPRPVRTEGSKAAVGDVQRCVYERGHLVKRITRCEDRRELAFEVLEQHLHFERGVRLRDGAFRLEPLGSDGTRVVLTTRYVRRLSPAWLWEPMERKIIHTLHGHVLEGMRRRSGSGDYDEKAADVIAARE